MPEKTFGQFIRAERELLSLTIEEASKNLGVSQTTLYHWEHDKKKPSKKHIRDIASLYCVSVKKLVQLLYKQEEK